MILIYLSMLESEDDRQYFLFLHRSYETKMYQVALNILRSHPLAEDAVQDGWVRVIKSFQKIKEISGDKTEGYIVTIVKNASLDILRETKDSDPFPEDWDAPAAEGQPMDEFERLVALIRATPEQYRRILELKLVLEYPNQDIARRLGMNESTVASRISRGRQLLIAKIQEEGYHYG